MYVVNVDVVDLFGLELLYCYLLVFSMRCEFPFEFQYVQFGVMSREPPQRVPTPSSAVITAPATTAAVVTTPMSTSNAATTATTTTTVTVTKPVGKTGTTAVSTTLSNFCSMSLSILSVQRYAARVTAAITNTYIDILNVYFVLQISFMFEDA